MNNPMLRQYRWDPFALAREMMRWDPFVEPGAMDGTQRFEPTFDILETEDGFSIVADVPGLTEDDIDVTITGNQVQIKGERTRQVQPEHSRYHLYERAQGQFVRTFTLPAAADPDAIEATLDNGVLTLRLPKAESARARKIPLKERVKRKLTA